MRLWLWLFWFGCTTSDRPNCSSRDWEFQSPWESSVSTIGGAAVCFVRGERTTRAWRCCGSSLSLVGSIPCCFPLLGPRRFCVQWIPCAWASWGVSEIGPGVDEALWVTRPRRGRIAISIWSPSVPNLRRNHCHPRRSRRRQRIPCAGGVSEVSTSHPAENTSVRALRTGPRGHPEIGGCCCCCSSQWASFLLYL